jgi:hypothetical protein
MERRSLASPTKFKLEILEYCSGRRSHPTEKCIKIEQHFINLLQPEYNILQIAGSSRPSLGFYHSEKTLCKMSADRKGIPKSEETRAKMSARLRLASPTKMGNYLPPAR